MTAVRRPRSKVASRHSSGAVLAVALRDRAQLGGDAAARRRQLDDVSRRAPARRAAAGVTTILPSSRCARARVVDADAAQELLRQPQPAAAADDEVALAGVARRLLADPAVADADDAVGDPRRGGIVADEDGGAALVARELADQVVEQRGALGVELARRLVGEEEPRPVRERGADGDALLLAARELARAAGCAPRAGRRARAARRRAARRSRRGHAVEAELDARRARAPAARRRARCA